MKSRRQALILELIDREPLHSQERLVRRLHQRGFEATHATVSRDIKERGLVKRSGDGAYQRSGVDTSNPETALTALERTAAGFLRSVERVQQLVVIRTGAGQAQPLAIARDRALSTGAVRAHVLDVREEFARQYVLRALRANALFRGGSSLMPALLRPLIAQKLVEIADIEQTLAIAHGYPPEDVGVSTAARALNPKIKVVASLPRPSGSSAAIPAAKPPVD